MVSTNQKINVLIVSAFGRLGSRITTHALQNPKLEVSILVRDPSKNKELSEQVEKAGGKVIKADLSDPASLKGVTKGVHTIISVVNSLDEKVNEEGQISLLNDGLENGLVRYIPSEYGPNLSHFTKEELNRTTLISKGDKFAVYLDKTPVKQLRFSHGLFTESFVNLQNLFGYWGDSDHKLNLTTFDDLARVIVDAVSNPDLTGSINFVGDRITVQEIFNIYNKIRGTNIQPKYGGSLEVLKQTYEEARNKGDQKANLLGLFFVLYDKRSDFEKIHYADFPQIKPTSVEEFFKQHPEIKFN